MKIFENQDDKCFAIICIDDKNCQKITKTFSKRFKSKLIRISTKKKLKMEFILKKKKTC